MSAEKVCTTCGTEYPANERFCPADGTALRTVGGGNDLVGSIIAERYHVLKKLGEGGMGQVYLAEHVKMGRKSAVKVMNPGMNQDADAISRFNREAANASRINHPNVAGIYDFGETADGLIYLAMEFIEGQSLTALVESVGALPPARAANIAKQAADGLAVAHDMGIVHRDLKPDNIMIAKRRDGTDLVKVVDFGIAKAAGAENQKVTKTGLVVGTPEYMSPEQLSGDKLTGQSDIYSLALVAFNMLTGKLPFPSETAQESMIMRLTDKPKTLAEMRPDVAWSPRVLAVMEKALERDAKLRYEKASDFGNDLYVAVEQMPKAAPAEAGTMVLGAATVAMVAPPPTRVASSAPSTPSEAAAPVTTGGGVPAKSRTPMLAGGGVLLAVAIGAGVMMMNKGGAPTPTKPADSPGNATPITADKLGTAQITKGADKPAGRSPGSALPDTRTANNPMGATPPGRGAPVLSSPGTASPGVSYANELDALDNQIQEKETALAVLKKVPDFRAKVTIPADVAYLSMIEGKALAVSGSLDKACKIFKGVRRADLDAKYLSDFDEGKSLACQ